VGQDGESLGVRAREGAEVGSLVHVDPQSVNVDTVSRVEEVGEFEPQ